MSKKLLAVLLAAATALFALAGCSGESYAFDALADTPAASAQVRGNGGTYVEKGNYSYFINGAENGAETNDFGGAHVGSIVRCLTEKLTSADRKVEVVVPKIIYAEDKASAGFYIYGDKIYYPTPNNVRNANGTVQYNKLDLMVANLNGTGTKRISTIDSVATAFAFMQSGDKVYVIYEGTDTMSVNGSDQQVTALYQIDTQTGEQKKIDNDISAYAIDRSEGGNTVAYTKTQRKLVSASGQETQDQKYNTLYGYVAGSEEAKTLRNGKSEGTSAVLEVMTVQKVFNGDVYYTYKQNFSGESGLAKVNVQSGTTTKLAETEYTNFLPFEENGENGIFVIEDGYIQRLTFKSGTVDKRLRLASAPSGDVTFERYIGGWLYYTVESEYVLYGVDGTKDLTENKPVATVISGMMRDTTWAPFDFTMSGEKVAVLYFNDQESLKFAYYLYMDVFTPAESEDGTDSTTSKRIGVLSKANAAAAEKNGDDPNGVEVYQQQED